jgi:hypothetical protein
MQDCGMTQTSDTASDSDLTRRAMAAWFRTGGTEQPGQGSGVAEVDGRTYVVLENVHGVMAVYRYTTTGQLKRLKRWPEELDTDT